ncbi:MAG: anthranilate phosphoribosyltransferase, partial [Gammaproteobacteria bacterium]|nr:anthranilate phosphoribosyltransferase [Gammaproteobacteria bacterium]
NPAGARRQLMGVFASDLTPFLANVFSDLGATSAVIVSGYGGLDELTTTGPNQISQLDGDRIETYTLDP